MAVRTLTVKRPVMGVKGAAGTDISGGIIQRPFIQTQALGEDYNQDFTIDRIDKMVKGDGQVFAVWNAISLAIQQADWDMVPFSDDPKDKEIAEFLENMIRPIWPGVLSQVLNYLLYGFMLLEPIFEVVDGQVIWSRLAPRLPWTVQDWVPGDGFVKEIVQYAWDYKTGQYAEFKIPGTKLIRFTNRQNGYNFEGEALALDTPIPTPSGWTTIGDIAVGDQVFDEEGKIRYVTGAKSWNDRPSYKITFATGESIIADANHKWAADRGTQRTPGIFTTEEMFADYADGRTTMPGFYSIDVCSAVQYPKQHQSIDPYVLGWWLADGTSNTAEITSKDAQTRDLLEACGYTLKEKKQPRETASTYRLGGLQSQLRSNDLLGNKHIPENYIHGSVDQRLSLLQGLMDGDGHCDEYGRCEFSNTNHDIVLGITELLFSLGIKARVQTVDASRWYEGAKTLYRVHFKSDYNVFRLDRKSERQNNVGLKSKRQFIHNIEFNGNIETKCIEVDSPSHLFLAGKNFVPTHNSILRGAYKHWHHKNTLYNILIIRHERFGIGVPVGTLDAMATDEQMEMLGESMKNMRSNELGYLLLPRGTDIDKAIKILVPEGGEAGSSGLIEAVEHHNVQIARSVLAQFINLGDTKTGARAVSEDMSSLFLMSLGAVVKQISQTISFGNYGENEGLKYLVDVNFGEVDGYPVWKCEKIKKDNSSAILATIAQLVQSGALVHDEALEKHTRRLVGVPMENIVPTEPLQVDPNPDINPRPDTKSETETDKNADTQGKIKTSGQQPDTTKLEEPFIGNSATQRLPWEEMVDFSRIESVLDTATAEWITIWRKYLKQQLDALGDFVGESITGAEAKQLSEIGMPFTSEMASEFLDIMLDVHVQGRMSVRREFLKQADPELQEFDEDEEEEDDDRLTLLAISAASAASSLSELVHRSIIDSVTTEIATKDEARWDDVSRRAWSISDHHVEAEAASINWAFGFGRESYAAEHADMIAQAYYSAVLDQNTCYVCEGLHGVNSSEQSFVTPNPDCLGNQFGSNGNPCRCITIWVLVPGTSVSDFL